ncbi:MAG: 2-oxoglutarate dehydrogenase E1 subunit family protein, partial [Phycisphaerales bacterium]
MAHQGPNSDSPSRHATQSINGWQSDFVEGLYAQYQADPNSVGPEWINFFRGFELGLRTDGDAAPTAGIAASIPAHSPASASAPLSAGTDAQRRVDELVRRYRNFGHLASQLDPLGTSRPFPDCLTLEAVGLDDGALGQSFDPGSLPLDNPSPLGEIIACLEESYCGTMGVEFTHLTSLERQAWLSKRLEAARNKPQFGVDVKKRILEKLLAADSFEAFLYKRYPGKKRFGLEGGETLIPILDQILESGPALGVQEFMLGMAHRGRLNVLANIVGKNLQQIFTEFDEGWTAA